MHAGRAASSGQLIARSGGRMSINRICDLAGVGHAQAAGHFVIWFRNWGKARSRGPFWRDRQDDW
jgi:hypothetical protein